MISAIQSALSGLRTASARFDATATDIVRSGAQAVSSFPLPPGGDASPGASTAAGNGLNASNFAIPVPDDGPSLEDGLISLKEAEILYKSSAKLLGVLLRSEGELLDIIA